MTDQSVTKEREICEGSSTKEKEDVGFWAKCIMRPNLSLVEVVLFCKSLESPSIVFFFHARMSRFRFGTRKS